MPDSKTGGTRYQFWNLEDRIFCKSWTQSATWSENLWNSLNWIIVCFTKDKLGSLKTLCCLPMQICVTHTPSWPGWWEHSCLNTNKRDTTFWYNFSVCFGSLSKNVVKLVLKSRCYSFLCQCGPILAQIWHPWCADRSPVSRRINLNSSVWTAIMSIS